jgi:hypothetical protein
MNWVRSGSLLRRVREAGRRPDFHKPTRIGAGFRVAAMETRGLADEIGPGWVRNWVRLAPGNWVRFVSLLKCVRQAGGRPDFHKPTRIGVGSWVASRETRGLAGETGPCWVRNWVRLASGNWVRSVSLLRRVRQAGEWSDLHQSTGIGVEIPGRLDGVRKSERLVRSVLIRLYCSKRLKQGICVN